MLGRNGLMLACLLAAGFVKCETVTVLTWNTEHYAFDRWSPAERAELEENMFALIRAANPDVVLVQETYGAFERFAKALPDYDSRLLGRCNSIYSRFRIVKEMEPYREPDNYTDPKGKAFNTMVCDLDAGPITFRMGPVALFWLPLSVRAPLDLTPEQMLAWEGAEQTSFKAAPRPVATAGILKGLKGYLAECDEKPILLAGDFNSHSHLDWTPATGDVRLHNGRVVAWPVSKMMVEAGFTDAYRAVHPDPAKDYGATIPVPGLWADSPRPFVRLDYVYTAGRRMKPVAAEVIAGPYHKPFTWRGKSFSMFPSDHAAVLVTFEVETYGQPLKSRPGNKLPPAR